MSPSPPYPLYRTVVLHLGYAYPRGYAKTSYRVCKIEKKNDVINTEKSGPDLEMATGDPDVRTFD
jgi:hypothetical protein